MNSRGLFIVFEGPEGSGKSTVARRLVKYLQERGETVVSQREPGGTPVGELIRNILLQEATPEEEKVAVPPRTEFLLFLASRSAYVSEFVRPALEEGKIVVADRFDLSTVAYQIAGRQLPLEEALFVNKFAKDSIQPDLFVLLLVGYEEGIARQLKRGKKADRIEAEGPDFHHRVHDAYDRFSVNRENLVRIDTNFKSKDEVFEQVKTAVLNLLERTS